MILEERYKLKQELELAGTFETKGLGPNRVDKQMVLYLANQLTNDVPLGEWQRESTLKLMEKYHGQILDSVLTSSDGIADLCDAQRRRQAARNRTSGVASPIPTEDC